jgi:hypothetical protein
MRVQKIEPRDILVTFEMTMEEVTNLLDFLDKCEIDKNTDVNPNIEKPIEVMNSFFNMLTEAEGAINGPSS